MNPTRLLAAAALLFAVTACTGPDPQPAPAPSPSATSDAAADCMATVGAWADGTIAAVNGSGAPPEIRDLPERYQPVADDMAGDVALAAGNPGTDIGDEAYDRAVDTLVRGCDHYAWMSQ